MREIEIKLKVKDFSELKNKLLLEGCVLSNPINQNDTIYSHKDKIGKEWTKPDEGDFVIRIRRQDNKSELTVKQQRSHELDNLEFETEVKDSEVMHQILSLLGYVPMVEVKKKRQKGKLGQYEICLDEVDELGTFVELEKLADDEADVATVEEDLFREMERLGVPRENREKRGYDTQIFHFKK